MTNLDLKNLIYFILLFWRLKTASQSTQLANRERPWKRTPSFQELGVAKALLIATLTLHQKLLSVDICWPMLSFWGFSKLRYALSRPLRDMFKFLGSLEPLVNNRWAIWVSKTLSQWTSNCWMRALVSSQKSWNTFTTDWDSRIYFRHFGNVLSFGRSKMKQAFPRPIYSIQSIVALPESVTDFVVLRFPRNLHLSQDHLPSLVLKTMNSYKTIFLGEEKSIGNVLWELLNLLLTLYESYSWRLGALVS